MKKGLILNGTVLSVNPTPKNAFVLKILLTDFIVGVHTKLSAQVGEVYSATCRPSDKGDFYFEDERIVQGK